MGLAIIILWSLRTSRTFWFYFYLWQLKEYQVRRFIDHFRTAKGKKLIFNVLSVLKLLLFIAFLFIYSAYFADSLKPEAEFILTLVLLALYLLESLNTIKNFFQKKLKIPTITAKTLFLIFLGFLIKAVIIYGIIRLDLNFAFWLLFFDLISPLIVSLLVLFLQPLAVFLRNRIVKKAVKKRGEFANLVSVGITGSYGKTSTKEFLAAILSSKFNVLKTKEHQNSEIAIARIILDELTQEHDIFIAEMGSYRKRGIRLLSRIVRPKIGIVTGINQQHLALFGSMENLISAEGGMELAENLPEDGVLVLNGNNEIINSKFKSSPFGGSPAGRQISNLHLKSKIFCSTKEKMDFWAENVKAYKKSIYFKVFSKDGQSQDFNLNLAGAFNVENILLATAVARELGMTLKEIALACQEIKLEQGAIKLRKAKQGFNIIDSSYSANPDGVMADLEYLKVYHKKRIVVMPCLIELGRASAEIHKKIGGKIAEVCDLAIVTSKDRFKEIREGAAEAGMPKENIVFIERPEKIVLELNNYLNPQDTVLFEGRIDKKVLELLV